MKAIFIAVGFFGINHCEMRKVNQYVEEGYLLMGAAFEVYNELGYGLSEELYQESLEHELHLRRIPYRANQEIKAYYKGIELRKYFIPDFVVFEGIIVELKSVKQLQPEHTAQLHNYLRLSRKPVGYLLNFGGKGAIEWKRYVLKHESPKKSDSEWTQN